MEKIKIINEIWLEVFEMMKKKQDVPGELSFGYQKACLEIMEMIQKKNPLNK